MQTRPTTSTRQDRDTSHHTEDGVGKRWSPNKWGRQVVTCVEVRTPVHPWCDPVNATDLCTRSAWGECEPSSPGSVPPATLRFQWSTTKPGRPDFLTVNPYCLIATVRIIVRSKCPWINISLGSIFRLLSLRWYVIAWSWQLLGMSGFVIRVGATVTLNN